MESEKTRRVIFEYDKTGRFLGAVVRGYNGIEDQVVPNIMSGLLDILEHDDVYGSVQFGLLVKDRLRTGLKLVGDT